ncbi:MAG: DUF3347 domain-containing protein [Bacteroidia bacterium]|nr:DUF3347 domain-containing protein [Bacteroidia bacterium]
MKNLHIIFSFLLISLLWACNSGEQKQENQKAKTRDFSTQTSAPQKEILNQWLAQYFNVKNALVASNPTKVAENTLSFSSALQTTNIADFKPEALEFLNLHKAELQTNLDKATQSQDIEEQRLAFVSITKSMYEIVKAFKPNSQKVYYQFCPMAFNDKGGYWLNEEEKVFNPYFGDKMLHCGKVEESF